jgi:acyl-CoA dehydrogenase
MDFTLSEEIRMIRDAVRQFVERELLPLEQEYRYEEANLPLEKRAELTQKLRDAGLADLYTPEEYGGPGIGFVGRVAVQEQIFATMVGYSAFGRPAYEGLFLCNEEQKAKYLIPVLKGEKQARTGLTEPVSGADPSMMVSYAEQRNGEYVINGRKTFISGPYLADFLLLYARLRGTQGREGITCFLMDTDSPGFKVERYIPVMGIPSGTWGELPCEVSLENVVLPAANVLGGPGEGWKVMQSSMGAVRLGFGPRAVAYSERCLKMARDYANNRVTFGRPLADRQATQWMLADSAIAIDSLRWMTYHAAWKLDEKQDARTEISMVKVFGTETMEQIADRAIQIHGAVGISTDLPLEGIFRSARADRIVDGPNEVHRFVIARNISRGHWFPGY